MIAAPETEHRSMARRTTLKSGHIVFNSGRSTIDCRIRNLSARGAKLQVASVLGIPESFDLMLEGHSRQPCQVIWRSLKELGVEFPAA
ncbi:MAG: PilZ domain-containing protein [Devosia sp.]